MTYEYSNCINAILLQEKAERRKTISLSIDEKLLDKVDEHCSVISKATDKFCSRNTFIEVAVSKFLEHTEDEINNIKFISSKQAIPNNQVIIFTANDKYGKYQSLFLGSNKWDEVYLGEEVRNLINNGTIKYLALYRSKPHQFIEAYSEIQGLYNCNDKYGFYLGQVQYLNNPIALGTAEPSSLMKGRTTTLQKLLNSNTIDQLF